MMNEQEDLRIINKPLEDVMHESMMPYAEHVIMDRALPRVEDGLKPVQRRILYSMYELKITPDVPTKKCARIVGECLGKYHPHGDSSVYEALVHLAQDFNMSSVLVDGQGNFGSIDGDGAAAMRYTEARLSPLAMELLRDLDKNTVTFSSNFDDSLSEPDMLPGRFPNLLVNGANGIAVGLATNIPTHNLTEVIDGTVAVIQDLIAKRPLSLDNVMQHIKGPDFPTGCEIVAPNMKEIYQTGKGKVQMRAVFHLEKEGDKPVIVFTHFPYQVNKQVVLAKIAEYRDKKEEGFECIADIVDESDREGVRAVIKLKRDSDALGMVRLLYKKTDLCKTCGINMVAIAGGKPKLMGLLDILHYYANYQRVVIKRRSEHDLADAKEKEEIARGLMVAINNIDEVVAIIKKASSATDAKFNLRARFGLSERQAQSILDMRLRRLCALEVQDLEKQIAELTALIATLGKIVSSERRQYEVVMEELNSIKRKYRMARRSTITADAEVFAKEETVVSSTAQNGVVFLHDNGTLKFCTARSLARSKKELGDYSGAIKQWVACTSDSALFVFTEKGNYVRMSVADLHERSLSEKGFTLPKLIRKFPEDDNPVSVFALDQDDVEGTQIIAYTSDGMARVTDLGEYLIRDEWGPAIKLKNDLSRVINVEAYNKDADVLMATRGGFVLRTAGNDLLCKGRLTLGAGIIKLDEGDEVIMARGVMPTDNLVVVAGNGSAKLLPADKIPAMGKMRKGTNVANNLLLMDAIKGHETVVARSGEEFYPVDVKSIILTDLYDRGYPLIGRLGVRIEEITLDTYERT